MNKKELNKWIDTVIDIYKGKDQIPDEYFCDNKYKSGYNAGLADGFRNGVIHTLNNLKRYMEFSDKQKTD